MEAKYNRNTVWKQFVKVRVRPWLLPWMVPASMGEWSVSINVDRNYCWQKILVRCVPRARLDEEGVWVCGRGCYCCQLEKELHFLADGCETRVHRLGHDHLLFEDLEGCDIRTTSLASNLKSQFGACWSLSCSKETFVCDWRCDKWCADINEKQDKGVMPIKCLCCEEREIYILSNSLQTFLGELMRQFDNFPC